MLTSQDWCARRGSNPQPSPSEGDALSIELRAQSAASVPHFSDTIAVMKDYPLRDLQTLADPKKAAFVRTFFKTGKGEYAEGDIFLGISVPDIRILAKKYADLSLLEVRKLLAEKYHEARLLALIILTMKYAKAEEKKKKDIVDCYCSQFRRMNNWDLVDCSASQILGAHLLTRKRAILLTYAKSHHLWTQRIAIVSTYAFIRHNEFQDTLRISKLFLTHKHDLIHKATGWMLREVGKRNIGTLRTFLDQYASVMPRTMLRYSIEKMSPEERRIYLTKKRSA